MYTLLCNHLKEKAIKQVRPVLQYHLRYILSLHLPLGLRVIKLNACKIFSLSLIFSCFTAMYLGVFLFVLMLLAVCSASQTCDLLSFVSFGKLAASIISNTVFPHFFFFSYFFLGLKILHLFNCVPHISFELLYIFYLFIHLHNGLGIF